MANSPVIPDERIAWLIRRAIAVSGLSAAEWCRRHNVQAPTVSRILAGEMRATPSVLRAIGLRRRQDAYERV